MQMVKLCVACIEKYRDAFTMNRVGGPAMNGKCEHCKGKTYVSTYEVSKKDF